VSLGVFAPLVQQARAGAAEFGARQLEAMLLSNLAQARTRLGDLAGAQHDADAALALSKVMQSPELMPDVLLGAAYPAVRARHFAEAARLIDQADAIRKSARGALFRARLLYEQRKYREAYAEISRGKAMGEAWYPQYDLMLRAFEESARTGKPSTVAFEEPLSAGR